MKKTKKINNLALQNAEKSGRIRNLSATENPPRKLIREKKRAQFESLKIAMKKRNPQPNNPTPEIVLEVDPEEQARGKMLLQDMDRLYEELPELLLVGRAASREFTEATREK